MKNKTRQYNTTTPRARVKNTDRFQGVVDRLRVREGAPDRARVIIGVVRVVPVEQVGARYDGMPYDMMMMMMTGRTDKRSSRGSQAQHYELINENSKQQPTLPRQNYAIGIRVA